MTSSVPMHTTTKITKLLIANRGEIAVRIIRAANDAGISTVAVYADQDRNALHVRLADEAYALHGDTPATTYLSVHKLLSVAQRAGANAVHPGYGFLSENSGFAQSVIDAGLIWVGPTPHAIDLLGDKVSARHIAEKVGAPLAPGTSDPVTTAEEIETFAEQVGLPVAIKAAFGGGGRGMRIVREGDSITEQFESATREAIAAFGRGECFVEKFLDRPRHVETQCLADSHGNVMVVSTRDCSLQRRNQKLVEEAPAPFITTDQHDRLVHASKAILKAAGYQGAGTCEFLIGLDGTISFLEVNTRLQVEHTVSEEVTGLDLVREQFKIAEGGVISEEDPVPYAHSIEFRINGEDPGASFMPRQGVITTFKQPDGPGVRVDTGVVAGDAIAGAFDSMMAKLVVTGRDRQEALQRARRALGEFVVTGVPTVIPFDRAVVEDPAFTAEDGHFGVYTTWIDTAFDNQIPAWDGVTTPDRNVDQDRTTVVLEVNDKRIEVSVPKRLVEGNTETLMRPAPKRRAHRTAGASSAGTVTAPMQATVTKVEVAEGDHVVAGDTLLVLEAMKMEQPLTASKDGTVTHLDATPGQTVSAGHVLLTIADE